MTLLAAGILLVVVPLVIVFFFWKTRRREGSYADEELEEGERPAYNRVIKCPNCETHVEWDQQQCHECGIIFEDDSFVCPRCSASAEPKDLECSRCGLVFMEDAWVCPNCKHAVEPGDNKCPRCKESFWSPLRLSSERGKEILRVEEKGRGGDEKEEEK